METQLDGSEDTISNIRNVRQQLEAQIESQHKIHLELLASIQPIIPNIVSSLDLSLKIVSSFNDRPFAPTPSLPLPLLDPKSKKSHLIHAKSQNDHFISADATNSVTQDTKTSLDSNPIRHLKTESESPLAVVRSMVAICLLGRVPFSPIDSSTVLRKLENDGTVTPVEKAALLELGGDSGLTLAVELALKSMAEDNGGVELEEFVVSGKSRIMVLNIDRTRLVRELPESAQYQQLESSSGGGNVNQSQAQQIATTGSDMNNGLFGMAGQVPRPMSDMWMPPGEPHMGLPPIFPGGGGPASMMGPRGAPRVMGMMGMPRGIGISTMHRPPVGLNSPASGSNVMPHKPRTEEDDMKDLEALLNKKSFREMQKSKTGEELLDLIHRPTARETAVAAKFKTKGGSQLKVYCSSLTKEDCRRQSGSFIACDKVHFRRIIAPHTDINLGDCSFLDTCRHMKTCKYVHYEYDPTPDVPPMMMGAPPPPKPLKPQRAEYCSEVELGEPQWINCDIRNFRMDILGQFGVIMADPPWDIHMELPYGTMADDEMRNLNVPALQTDGLIFLWVTGRAMELGRECLELWGYKRVEELIWVKTNQLQRIIRTGRTGHWLNHSKEHCLVGIKGNPEVNRNIDTDVIVAEVRETSRKPDEMYPMLERISPRTRKLELFARMHNTHAGWMSLGNQLHGVRLVDEGLRARFKAAYPDVEVQPPSPPRASAMDVDSGATAQMRSPFAATEPKSTTTQFREPVAPETAYPSEEKSMHVDAEIS
ncbi:N6-adenosine-methyltransferase MT-A70-like [Neltuma alba]|uniref:N6-adenosine-methyltransferase MT-A70-like n=1 Tax=Neltuma alba TaxID=207710 RepID=UPI0010A2D203|nr:N6-adenosine-methyltransferase MT-A70-like [Prosopis alba]XP_028803781.1 N6-adenosine-methyltransferase MT-A70-like [Prosopis alba]XP_028803786.1 N6-adenosine-methyltransferase MT-A70-like [Prosopis alba]XP_028803795.1 N6-adenosine-methyltransferase MT-A70-like [Prosopis alba]